MSRVCQVTGKGPMVGNKVSHANNKTKRRFLPNLHSQRFWLENEKRFVRLRVSRQGLRIIDKKGATTDVTALLGQGGTVCFIADQNAGSKGIFVDFFGRKATSGYVGLVNRSGSPVSAALTLFGSNGAALASEFDRPTRKRRTWIFDDGFATAPRKVWELSSEDRYRDPGSPVFEPDGEGHPVRPKQPRNRDTILSARDEGRTVIFSTHNMDQAEQLCEQGVPKPKAEKVLWLTISIVRGFSVRALWQRDDALFRELLDEWKLILAGHLQSLKGP